jgi:type IV pilus assembly protein PilA
MKSNIRKAFTLIEILIVIGIIGVLAAALIPRLTGIQGRARDTKRMYDIRQLSKSIYTYWIDNNTYPPKGNT